MSIEPGTRFYPRLADLAHSGSPFAALHAHMNTILTQVDNDTTLIKRSALAYLTLLSAFCDQGFLELDWAPSLTLEIEGEEFEVLLNMCSQLSLDNSIRRKR